MRKANIPIRNKQMASINIFSKKINKWSIATQKKMLSVLGHERNSKQSHRRYHPVAIKAVIIREEKRTDIGEDMEK